LDGSVPDETVQKQLKYARAYFYGMKVKLLKPGQKIVGRRLRVPYNFIKKYKIESRKNDWSEMIQYHASNINKNLKKIKPKDAYAIIAITTVDLYPRPSWNFVYGQANWAWGTSIYSFARLGPKFEDQSMAHTWFRRQIWTLVHELTHLFTVKHCTFYECTMNGAMTPSEQLRHTNSILCPVCIKKLKRTIGFDVLERFQALEKVATELGLDEEAKQYRNIMKIMGK